MPKPMWESMIPEGKLNAREQGSKLLSTFMRYATDPDFEAVQMASMPGFLAENPKEEDGYFLMFQILDEPLIPIHRKWMDEIESAVSRLVKNVEDRVPEIKILLELVDGMKKSFERADMIGFESLFAGNYPTADERTHKLRSMSRH